MVIVLFYRQGIMGTKEFSWEGFFGFFRKLPQRIKNLGKKHKRNTETVKEAQ